MLEVGTKAPLFEAPLDNDSAFRLADLAGDNNVVLYFYPRDGSAGCTKQACRFRDSYASIRAYDAVIVGVSRDSLESHRSFKERNSLSFPIASDEDAAIHDLYEVRPMFGFLRPRITYVIDKSGIIRAAFRHDFAIGRHLPATLASLESIQAPSRT